MTTRKIWTGIACLVGLAFGVCLGVRPLLAEQSPDLRSFVDRIDVNLVNIDVYVTDKSGQPVFDLAPEDFEIFEDGKPVSLTNFFAGNRTDPLKDPADPTPAPSVPADDPPPPPAVAHHLVIYIDHFNITPANRQRVFAQVETFLEERLDAGDQIMLMGYDRSLDVVQPFTRDLARLRDGIESMRKVATTRQIRELERQRILRAISNALRDPNTAATVDSLLASYIDQVRQDLIQTTAALQRAVEALSSLEGRKSLLYVSDGLPRRPGESLLLYLEGATNQTLLQLDQSRLFRQITRAANAHRVTFFTLDARGTDGGSSHSAEFGDLGQQRAILDAAEVANLQEPLLDLAVATGGQAILNTFNFDGVLSDLSRNLESYYSLGYLSKNQGDAKFHRIAVKVKRPGLTVRHREGFVNKPQEEQIADKAMSVLLLGKTGSNPLAITLEAGQPVKKRRGRYQVQILVRIPFDQITLLPVDGQHEGRLKIFVAVRDEQGVSETQQIPYPISIPDEAVDRGAGQDIAWSTKLLIREGKPTIVVGVWDEVSGVESFTYRDLVIGQAEDVKNSVKSGR